MLPHEVVFHQGPPAGSPMPRLPAGLESSAQPSCVGKEGGRVRTSVLEAAGRMQHPLHPGHTEEKRGSGVLAQGKCKTG